MDIWIVTASSGRYDDYRSWNVMAFSTEDLAKEFVSKQPEINLEAVWELEKLKYEYKKNEKLWDDPAATIDEWEAYENECEILEEKAVQEMKIKYPGVDLTCDQDFHGYSIEQLRFKEN